MPRVKRLRWTDWLGLVGLVMLLAWTPGYVAQDETEKRLTGGETFVLPMPRLGDHLLLDLAVRHADGRTERYESLVDVRIEALPEGADLIAPDAVYRHVIRHREAAFDLGLVRYASNETTYQTWYDRDGLATWHQTTGEMGDVAGIGIQGRRAPPTNDTYDPPMYGGRPQGCERLDALNRHAGREYRYEPDTLAQALDSIADDLPEPRDERPCTWYGPPKDTTLLARAYETPAGLLYGLGAASWDDLIAALLPNLDDENDLCPLWTDISPLTGDSIHSSPFPFPTSDFGMTERVRLTRELELPCRHMFGSERWEWMSADFPLPVGLHVRYDHADDQPIIQLDLVPRVMERGDGPALPVMIGDDARGLDAAPTRGHFPPPSTTQGQLQNDATPLLHGLTLADIDSVVREQASGELAEFLAAAHMIGWQFRNQDNGAAVEQERASLWNLIYAQENGDRRSVSVTLRAEVAGQPEASIIPAELSPATQAARQWVADVRDVCTIPDLDDAQREHHCGPIDPALAARERPVLFPAEYRDQMADLSQNPYGSLFEPGPDRSANARHDPLGNIESHRAADGSYTNITGRISWSFAAAPPNDATTRLFLHGSSYIDRWELASIGNQHYHRDHDAPSTQPDVAVRPTGDSYDIIHLAVTGRGLAWSGLFLMAMAALARIYGATMSGAIPVFAAGLYAKIRNEDVLLHDRRDAIAAALRADPGLTAKELAARLDAGWGATVHHLETLRRAGLVTRIVVGRNRHHFLAKESTATARRLAALRRDPAYAAFLDAVVNDPGRSLDEIAATLSRSMSGLSRTGSRLAKEGVVEKRKEGRTVRFYPVAHP